MAKVSGVTYPSDLVDTDVASEANFFGPVYDSIVGLDAAVGMHEPLHVATSLVSIGDGTETNLMSFTVPAGALGTANAIKYKLFCMLTGAPAGDEPFVLKLKYGSSTVVAAATMYLFAGSSSAGMMVDGVLVANGTGAQRGIIQAGGGEAVSLGSSKSHVSNYGTSSEASTSALTMSISFQWTAFTAGINAYCIFGEAILMDVS